MKTPLIAEQLVKSLADTSAMQELNNSLNVADAAEAVKSKMEEFEIEMERLSVRIEHLRAQNDVLTLTLRESKNHCDNLTVLIGKYESNHTALRLMIGYADHIIDGLQALGNDESAAKKALARLEEAISRPDSGLAAPNYSDSSLESGSGSGKNSDVGGCERRSLREIVGQLKTALDSVRSTTIAASELQSFHSLEESEPASTALEARTADLETAVLIQELMAIREERADLRAQVFQMEKEKKSLELVLGSQNAQEVVLKTHIRQLQFELEDRKTGENEGKSNNKDDEMRTRISELLQTLEKVKRSSEVRHHQQEEVIQDLKRTNT